MGCDIHVCLEYKDVGNGWNICLATIMHLPRWYALFGAMGNHHRSNVQPVFTPRGLPADMDYWTKVAAEEEGIDGHTHSWLSTEELAEALGRACDGGNEDYKSPDSECLLAAMRKLDELGHPARIVYWFDN
jgi:hypothetical protein